MRMGERATTRDVVLRLDDLSLPARRLTVPSRLRVSELLRELPLPVSSSSFYLTADGRPLPLTAPVASLPPSGSIQLRLRALRGGGGDGGATGAESRDCYLSMYLAKKPDKADPNEARLSRFTCCALSGEPLAAPAVADRLGNLFNKEALVEALLHKRLPKALSHIRGLKDMIPIHLHPKPDADAAGEEVRFQCPITGLEFNGKYQFLALRKCGHVLSVKALKEVKSSACLVCHKEFDEADKMPLNGTDEEVTALRQRMEEERGKVKEKKEKKVGNGLSGSKHATAAAAMAGADKLENGKKGEAPSAKRFKASDHAPAYANKEVYASIFTSSKKSDFKETYSCRSLPLGRN
ncbi:replication termination factor 2 [Oryza brachyantha]|uniref:replication termination factor 2 n=1 Tax=Oryza brachyantha TaxID=4533 RepID=UPI001AD98CE1|nr:replication termination factor 2 [Oryza brachyantha]